MAESRTLCHTSLKTSKDAVGLRALDNVYLKSFSFKSGQTSINFIPK